MNGAQRAAVALLLLALAFLSWLMLTLLDRQAAQGQQQPVKLIPPISLVRGPQPPANRSFPRLALALASAPTGPADHSTTAGGTPTPQANAVSPAGTRSPAVNAEGEAAATAGPSDTQWAKLRDCESGGNYRVNTGNGYYGAYQFDLPTWRSNGGRGRPDLASPSEQDRVARLLFSRRGAQPWPVCGRWLR